MTTQTSQSQYMFLLRQPHAGPPPSPEEMEKIMERFMVWMKEMSSKDHVLGSNGLDLSGKVLRGPRGATTSDGPYAEAKEIVGGYVHIRAENLDEALELARGCPGLDYRMVVEVRPIKH